MKIIILIHILIIIQIQILILILIIQGYNNNIKIISELSRVRPPTYMIVILFYP